MSIIDKDIPYGPLPLADRMAAVWQALGEAERDKFIDDVTRSDNPTLTVYAWEQTLELEKAETLPEVSGKSYSRSSDRDWDDVDTLGPEAAHLRRDRGCTGGCRCGGSCN